MKRLMTYLFFVSLACSWYLPAYASTDLLSNAMTQSNNFLKEAGLVQKKYSGIAREYVTSKTGNLNNLAGERAKKYTDKANSLKKKAEKVQKWMKMAKEKKAELEDKYNKLNEQAAKYKNMADDAIAEGKAIKESYKTIKSNAEGLVDEAKNVKNMAEEMKDQALGDIKDAASTVKEAASINDDSDETTASETTARVSEVVENDISVNTEEKLFRQPVQGQRSKAQSAAAISQSAIAEKILPARKAYEISQPNKADAIRSAAVMADQSRALETAGQFIPMQMSEMPVVENTVSAADIMVAAEKMPVNTTVNEQRSDLNIEEQLMVSSNKAVKIKQSQAASAKMISNKKIVEPQKRSALRRLFDTVTGQNEVAEKISKDVPEQETAPFLQSEKSAVSFQAKEKVNDKAL